MLGNLHKKTPQNKASQLLASESKGLISIFLESVNFYLSKTSIYYIYFFKKSNNYKISFFFIRHEYKTNHGILFLKLFFIMRFGTSFLYFVIICTLSLNVSSFLEEVTKLLDNLTALSAESLTTVMYFTISFAFYNLCR